MLNVPASNSIAETRQLANMHLKMTEFDQIKYANVFHLQFCENIVTTFSKFCEELGRNEDHCYLPNNKVSM